MSRRAWVYIGSVLATGTVFAVSSVLGITLRTQDYVACAVLALLSILVQLFEASAPGHQPHYTHLVFLFAGVLLLPPGLFIVLAAAPHLAEGAQKRLTQNGQPDGWYLQPFNIATHVLAGGAARCVLNTFGVDLGAIVAPGALLSLLAAGLAYVLVYHVLIGLYVALENGTSWRKSGIISYENMGIDLVQVCLGYIVAVLWQLNPWLALPALSPLILIYRVLRIPQLQQEARTDAKTGLLNARHFQRLFAAELQRARRFGRPLAVMMADLDLLRNINNTYGHLAGDVVLAGVGSIIRQNTRDYDVAGRFGGEEFTLVLPEVTPSEACELAEVLRQGVASATFRVRTSATPISVTISIGVACYPFDGSTVTDLIHRADIAVYQAKLRGRNRVVTAAEVAGAADATSLTFEERYFSMSADEPAEPEERLRWPKWLPRRQLKPKI